MSLRVRSSRLRRRLAWLMLLSLVPAFVLMLYASNRQRLEALEVSRESARRYVSLAWLEFSRSIDATRDLLFTVAHAPVVVDLDEAGCTPLMLGIAIQHPEVLNIGLADLDGDIVCSALSRGGARINIADREYFRGALERRGFSFSGYYRGRLTGVGSVAFAMPVFDEGGTMMGVVFTATRFSGFDRVASSVSLDPGDLLLLLDRDGTVIGRFPDDDQWTGRNFPEHPLVREILERRDGTGEFVSLDGVPRRFSFQSVDVNGEHAYSIAIGIDERAIGQAAGRTFALGVGAIVLVGLSGFAILWFGAGRVFGRRLDEIVATAQALEHGNASARVKTGSDTGRGDELDLIAAAFNSMADALAQRENDWLQANRALEEARALNASILDSLSARIVVLDAHGRVLATNAAWGADQGAPAAGVDYLVALHEDRDLLEGGWWHPMCDAITGVLAPRSAEGGEASDPGNGPCASVEYAREEAGEARWYEMRVTPLRGAAGGAVVAHEDIDERKRLALRLEELVAELGRSNRELQDFAYVASHDLQEPLRKVVAFAGRFESAYADQLDARGLDYLARMCDAARRMQQLIDDLLKMSRVHTRAQPMRRVELDAIVAEVLSDLEERIAESGARVRVSPLPAVTADATQIRQVVQNLVGNALKFVPAGGVPDIEVVAEPVRAGWVRVCVRDRGIGIPDDVGERIFAPFVRLHGRSEYEGSGLGLAVVRRIVERHRGRVEAMPRAGGGACFCFELPTRDL
ncbi:MAG: HAMP domain-containing protein [Azoarcus sp.]|nr:HAMP domain-containing protein [Azoarcus sp.]